MPCWLLRNCDATTCTHRPSHPVPQRGASTGPAACTACTAPSSFLPSSRWDTDYTYYQQYQASPSNVSAEAYGTCTPFPLDKCGQPGESWLVMRVAGA